MEFIMYICITGIMLVSSVSIAFMIINNQIKQSIVSEINDNGNFAINKISYLTKRASAINAQTIFNVNPGKLILDFTGEPQITIDTYQKQIIANGTNINILKLRMKQGSSPAIDLTSDKVHVTDFLLTDLSGTYADSVSIYLTLQSINPSNSAIYASQKSWGVSLTVRKQ